MAGKCRSLIFAASTTYSWPREPTKLPSQRKEESLKLQPREATVFYPEVPSSVSFSFNLGRADSMRVEGVAVEQGELHIFATIPLLTVTLFLRGY